MSDVRDKLITSLHDIDVENAPMGIYGLPGHLSEGKFPMKYKVIFSKRYDSCKLVSRLSFEKELAYSKQLVLKDEKGYKHAIQFLNIADTKVRAYGDKFRLDRHHGKMTSEDANSVQKKLSSMMKDAKKNLNLFDMRYLVVFIFVDLARKVERYTQSLLLDDFLNKNGLEHSSQTWEDPHGRGFFTSVHCWSLSCDRSNSD